MKDFVRLTKIGYNNEEMPIILTVDSIDNVVDEGNSRVIRYISSTGDVMTYYVKETIDEIYCSFMLTNKFKSILS